MTDPITLSLLALATFAALFTGSWFGKRQAASELSRRESELHLQWQQERQTLETQWQRERQETGTAAALAGQREQQLQQDIRRLSEQSQALQQGVQQLRSAEAELERQLSALEEQHRSEARRVQERDQQLIDSRQQLGQHDSELRQLRSELARLQSELAEIRTARSKEKEASSEQIALLNSNREQLKQEFENLAHQIFEHKQQHFQAQSQQGLDALLKPFKEQLESFRSRVDQVHTESVQGQSSMKGELLKLMELNQHITTEASNLTRALKGDKKLQGNWGEQKVELLLEQAGLRKGHEYQREANFKDDEGSNLRPDFVVHLPEGKHIIIDSKVSLVDYTRYVSTDSDEERNTALAAHVQALRNHINGLSGKQYPELTGMNSPDFVFLFMPIEPAYLAAAGHSPALFQEAYEKRIAIVTSTTLLPVLRVVANLWGLQRQNQNTRELADQAAKVHDKLRIFVEKLDKLGCQINSVQKGYKDAFDTLRDGRGSLVRTVERFSELGVKVVKKLPDSVAGQDELELLEPENDAHL